MEVPWEVLLKKKFKNVHLFIKDIEELLRHVGKNLRPEIQNYTYSSGVQKELFVLDGTIPITFRGVNYNIPLCVLLQEDHPLVPPLVYVRPTNSMVIIPSQHVDTEGRVYHPYLNQWDPVNESSDITSLLQIMCSTFSEASPVYSKRPPRQDSSNKIKETQPRTTTANPLPQDDQTDDNYCIVCMELRKDSVLIPCGHLGICFKCANRCKETSKTCPVCREKITEVHRVYQP
ncbi:tumor susceptibility gene 101 protein-like [Acropora millepora]|uniref:tumor susceptibility gene 101 protein-like n=1 Tax=Acropora millepora TaxID=45264 RepID=UPI001CF357A6|nr:tumor susceptibility gene 101 protein-like [Acropora millepora]